MPRAWQIRDYQRQRLIEKLVHMIMDKDDTDSDWFLDDLAIVILEYLEIRCRHIKEENMLAEYARRGERRLIDNIRFFLTEIVPKIDSFARTPAEERVILAELIEKVLKMLAAPLYSDLRIAEMNNPRLMFKAASATTEVSLPDDLDDFGG